MTDARTNPTPYPEVNALLRELFTRVEGILGNQMIGMYLFGSLAGGDFDEDSDIDVAILTDHEISDEMFAALKAMHAHFAEIASPWANQFEVSYLSQNAMRRYDAAHGVHPHLDRGKGEQLHLANHARLIERYVLRERGIVMFGPPLQDRIDPISPNELRRAVLELFPEWLAPILQNAKPFDSQGYQSYTVLSLCRMLYTLEQGAVVSKRLAARWAQEELDARWTPLIKRAWVGRHHPQLQPDPDDVRETLEFARYMIERAKKFERSKNEAA